ncbi:MAG: ABC transporter substrate binding protein [Candidatus Rokuibacteriota bacterium]
MRGLEDVDRVFTAIRRERAEALNVLGGRATIHTRRVADRAIKNRLPTISTTRGAAEDGFLMTYGADFPDLYRRAATYVDRILKGAKPSELPVELTHGVRAGDQPQDRQGARPDDPANAAAAGAPVHRVTVGLPPRPHGPITS